MRMMICTATLAHMHTHHEAITPNARTNNVSHASRHKGTIIYGRRVLKNEEHIVTGTLLSKGEPGGREEGTGGRGEVEKVPLSLPGPRCHTHARTHNLRR